MRIRRAWIRPAREFVGWIPDPKKAAPSENTIPVTRARDQSSCVDRLVPAERSGDRWAIPHRGRDED
jgi:hypothetical protein